MMLRQALKARAKAQIRGNIGVLFVGYLLICIISATGIGSLLTPALNVGMIAIFLELIRGVKPGVADVFSRLETFGKALWLSIITAFFTWLWSLLLIIPGIVKALSYSLAPYVLAEKPELSARQALDESKEITQGYKWRLFVLELSFLPWALLVGITFGIAAIWVVPYMQATLANFYDDIKGGPVVLED